MDCLSTLSPVSPSPSKGKGKIEKEGRPPLLDALDMGLDFKEKEEKTYLKLTAIISAARVRGTVKPRSLGEPLKLPDYYPRLRRVIERRSLSYIIIIIPLL